MSLNRGPFVWVDHTMTLVHDIGIDRVLIDLASEVEADFLRGLQFCKTQGEEPARGQPLRRRRISSPASPPIE